MAQQKQVYKQKQKKGQTQEQKIIKTQLLLDQLDNTFFALDELVKEAKTNKNQNELAGICSIAVTQVNLFGASCKIQNKKGNERALHLLSYKLYEFCLKYNGDDADNQRARQILNPYAQYIQCAVNGNKIKPIPAIETDDDDWTDDVANDFMSNYLGAQHVTDDKISKYSEKKQQKKLEKEFEATWKANKRTLLHVIQNPKQVSPEQFYKAAGIGLHQLDIKKKPLSNNVPLRMQLDLTGDCDDDGHHGTKCKQGGKGKSKPKHYQNNKKQGKYDEYDDENDYNMNK